MRKFALGAEAVFIALLLAVQVVPGGVEDETGRVFWLLLLVIISISFGAFLNGEDW